MCVTKITIKKSLTSQEFDAIEANFKMKFVDFSLFLDNSIQLRIKNYIKRKIGQFVAVVVIV